MLETSWCGRCTFGVISPLDQSLSEEEILTSLSTLENSGAEVIGMKIMKERGPGNPSLTILEYNSRE